MDEAETLGDRIAVLSHGQLLRCGSPGFLKSNLGQGLHLYILKTGESFVAFGLYTDLIRILQNGLSV